MAMWITHSIIADKVLNKGLSLDRKGFVIGNIAPDCNIESEDWTSFVPPKEVTHFMSTDKKLSVDYERFYDEYIKDVELINTEHEAFLYGYYAHLITDLKFQKFIRNEQRVQNTYKRIKTNESLYEIVKDKEHNFDTIKLLFGTKLAFKDIEYIEHRYLNEHKDASYLSVLKDIIYFEDYLAFLPKNAIVRKLGVMIEELKIFEERELYFFDEKEYFDFIEETSELIYNLIRKKINS